MESSTNLRIPLGVLLSGKGSNFEAILQAIDAGQLTLGTVVCVGSNKAAARGLELARARQIEAFSLRPSKFETLEAYDQEILNRFQQAGVKVIVLAGYTRRISSVLLQAYPGRILNIHPSLLPRFGGHGMFGHHVHAAVLTAQETESGCSVHTVTEGIDEGPVLAQATVPVLPDDTPETLAARVLEQEHRLYPVAIQKFLENLPK